jgi:hypothetical protein
MKPRPLRVTEDYAIFGVHEESEGLTGAALAARHDAESAQLLRSDVLPLTEQEVAEVMGRFLS